MANRAVHRSVMALLVMVSESSIYSGGAGAQLLCLKVLHAADELAIMNGNLSERNYPLLERLPQLTEVAIQVIPGSISTRERAPD